jgi:mannose-6-phosphate isomerase-like protein (cupin superfamily)
MVVLDINGYKEFSEKQRVKKELIGPGCPIETYKLEVDLFCLQPGQERELQKRSFADCILLVLEGEGVFKIFLDEKPVRAGNLTFAAAGTEQSFKNTGNAPMVVFQVTAPSPEVGPTMP